jgi:hypothetical protein
MPRIKMLKQYIEIKCLEDLVLPEPLLESVGANSNQVPDQGDLERKKLQRCLRHRWSKLEILAESTTPP